MGERFLYNNKTFKKRRGELRRNQTPAEKLLWRHIRKDNILGLRFLRQYSAGPYILDFYCPKIRLGIEVDGDIHKGEESKFYDKDRERYLDTLDIKIIRFWNDEILKNSKEIATKIKNAIKKLGSERSNLL